jgi:hypothetical protein
VSDNLKLWNSVCKSDKRYLKQVSFGRKFTAIDPQYQVRCATEAFGVVGHGWGWTSETRVIDLKDGDTVVFADVSIWTGTRENVYGCFTGCRTLYNAQKKKIAEDAPKMAVTDALTKGLSHLGFNADVFLGEYDGNKYVQDSYNNFQPKAYVPKKQPVTKPPNSQTEVSKKCKKDDCNGTPVGRTMPSGETWYFCDTCNISL